MGKGTKFDFAKLNKNKCAEFYEVGSDFDKKKPHAPSFSFGISRNFFEKVYCETNIQYEKNVPGPGQYEASKKFGNENPKYSIYGRLKRGISQSSKIPGPGDYKIIGTNPLGKFPVSSFQNATNIIFGNSKENRFNYSCNNHNFFVILYFFINFFFKYLYFFALFLFNLYLIIYKFIKSNLVAKNPSPSHYILKPLIDGTGKIYNSRYKSGMSKTMAGKVSIGNKRFASIFYFYFYFFYLKNIININY